MKGRKGILNDVVHRVWMFSARTENGPVSPNIVRG